MFCRWFSCFVCTFVAVAIATGYSGQESRTGSGYEVTERNLTIDSTESYTAEPVQEVRPSTAVDLGALLDAGEGAVVTLVAGDTRLAAHRAVLSARSAVFQRLLQDAATGEVAVPDVEGPVLRQLLSYLYTLQAPQLPAVAPQLLAAAHQYGLPALKADCERQVAKQLTVENAAATAVLAVSHSSDSLMKAALAYIRRNIFRVMATQGWADAIKSQPEVWIKVVQLLSESPAETSTPASASSTATPTTVPHSDHSRHSDIPASTASPTTPHLSISSGSTAVSLLWSPESAGTETSSNPATQPHSDRNGRQTPATAVTTMAAQIVTQTDDDHISLLRSLSEEEKAERLIQAAEQGEADEVRRLLAAGADAGATDEGDDRWSALHYAARYGHVAVTRQLLAAGADPNARNEYSRTPLHFAAYNGHAEVAKLLLQAGADRGATDLWVDSPLDDARNQGHQELVDILE